MAVTFINCFEFPVGREDEFFELFKRVNAVHAIQARLPGAQDASRFDRMMLPFASSMWSSGLRRNIALRHTMKVFKPWSGNLPKFSSFALACTKWCTNVRRRAMVPAQLRRG